MNASRLAALLLGNPTRLRTAIAPLALALVCAATLASCAGVPGGAGASTHTCADKVAQAAVSGSVPGLWACLSPEVQANLTAAGVTGDGALVNHPFASSYVYAGSTATVVFYELVLTPSEAKSQDFHYLALVVWLNSKSGKVTGLAAGNSPS